MTPLIRLRGRREFAVLRAWTRLSLGALAVLLWVGAASAWASADSARITAEKQLSARAVELTISTPAFTVPTHVDVDLPVGYASQRHRRWPVTYVLAGTMNTYATFNNFVHGVKLSQSFPSIIVSPNGDSGYWSDWYNFGKFGPPMYETYVIRQLIPLIDAHFRTIPRRSERAVMGVSMGGSGSMMFAAEHPDLFADAASLSGAVDSNLPYMAAAVTASPEFQGAPPDSIYGPEATQAVRWHGHNPTDLAANLRGLDLEVLTANGIPNPGIGENLLSADSASCVIEQGVQSASIEFNNTLNALRIPHIWHDYGPGCHTAPNFEREITATFQAFTADFSHPPAPPVPFSYMSIQPRFDIWGWRIAADPRRALEFLHVDAATGQGLTLVGSGTTTVTTPPLFRGLRRVGLSNASQRIARPVHAGRITFTVALGPPDSEQEYTAGATTREVSRTVRFAPYAVIRVTRARALPQGLHLCARALGGTVVGRARLLRSRGHSLVRGTKLTLAQRGRCRLLAWTRRPDGGKANLVITGRDDFGHAVRARVTIKLPVA